ncbi:MAG: hypothetical protein AB7Q00_14580 [Phycisphaerales bacterium]
MKVIAVNNGIFLYPPADVVYATDLRWWKTYYAGVNKVSDALRVSTRPFPGVHRVAVPEVGDNRRSTIIFNPKGLIGSGGNSGFQALNLAVQFGAKRIILVGFDMTVEYGTHWHGDHPGLLRNPEADLIDKWRRTLDKQSMPLREAGVTVLNASPYSALEAYPKLTLMEALNAFLDDGGRHPMGCVGTAL